MLKRLLYCTPAVAFLMVVLVIRFGDVLPALPSNIGQLALTALVVAGIAVATYLLWPQSQTATRTVRVNIGATGDLADTIDHEVGHGKVGQHVGGRILKARIYDDGSGWCDVYMPANATPAQYIALALGGAFAEGVSINSGPCAGDRKNIARYMSNVPRGQRAAVRREAVKIGRRGVNGFTTGRAASMQRSLTKRGTY